MCGWVNLTRWMYPATGGGGGGGGGGGRSWRTGERHGVMIVESIFPGELYINEFESRWRSCSKIHV